MKSKLNTLNTLYSKYYKKNIYSKNLFIYNNSYKTLYYIYIKNQNFNIIKTIKVNKNIEYYIIEQNGKIYCLIIKKIPSGVNKISNKFITKPIIHKFYLLNKLNIYQQQRLIFVKSTEATKNRGIKYNIEYLLKRKNLKKKYNTKLNIKNNKKIKRLLKKIKKSKIQKKTIKKNVINNKYEKLFNLHLKEKKSITTNVNKYNNKIIISKPLVLNKYKPYLNLLVMSLNFNKSI